MRQSVLIRNRIIRMLSDLRVHISMLPEHEHDALTVLEGPNWLENTTEIANLIMVKLGHAEVAPKDPRFDKTRRALAKKHKRLRGVVKHRAKPPEAPVVPLTTEEPTHAEG